ncbi:hypothetical protein ACFSKY_06300 [Azotobacter chroococcum]|uniref:Uncharacterized protein n=1 Tax=Azotobacter chroococcum TaxID=353 RepID=A0A4R1PXG1_9GAMM|nr:hypothetical protein [Azotobacter chroococcum]TBV91320.1 hypothetical protein E0E53_21520 [Azotobacter chroococcum]TCL32526.1 hypothetical protein EV691_10752 [Azotobacter chroococcum]
MISHMSVSVAEAGVSDPTYILGFRETTISVIPASADALAKCQYSTSSRKAIQDGSATWIDWPKGNISLPATDVILFRATAVRLQATGAAVMEIIGSE